MTTCLWNLAILMELQFLNIQLFPNWTACSPITHANCPGRGQLRGQEEMSETWEDQRLHCQCRPPLIIGCPIRSRGCKLFRPSYAFH